MQDNNETGIALFKALVIWVGALIGSITMSQLVLFATLIYTCMQGYVLWRDKIQNHGGKDEVL